MIVSVDLGYGYVKAISKKNKVIFPSATAPAKETVFKIDGLQSNVGHIVTLKSAKSDTPSKIHNWFIGDLALKEGRGTQISLNREKFNRANSLALILTAVYLAGGEGQIDLAYGVPLAYYEKQKNIIKETLKTDTGVFVSVDGGPERYINLKNIHVYPQGVGVIFSGYTFPKEGLIGILDIGYHTSDYLLIEISQTGINPLISYSSSSEVGVHTAQKLFADEFRETTGKALTLVDVQSMWNKSKVTYLGNNIEIETMKKNAIKQAAQTTLDTVEAAWSEKIEFLDGLYLAGGGSLEFFDVLKDNYQGNLVKVIDPQFSNAQGFYNMTKRAIYHISNVKAN